MDPVTLLIVCPLVFVAGLVDSIAGGGGLISITAFMLAGLPAHTALGTNKLTMAVGTAVSTARLAKNGFIKISLAIPAACGALLGSSIGAKLALLTPEGIFQILMMVALPIIAFLIFRKPTLDADENKHLSMRRQFVYVAIIALLIGGYDGFYGPGTGTFMIIAFTAFANQGVRQSAGLAKVANLSSNIAALIMFLHAGTVWIQLGLIGAVFTMAGNYIGSGMVVKDGSKIVRPVIIVVIGMLFVKVVYDLLF